MNNTEIKNYITDVDILDEAKECFLTYSEEVLTDRAIPAVEDGLLSVQRKILWTMNQILNMNIDSKTKKSASIVGSTMASSYFHSDASCYGALCKMAQSFLMRYPLIAGQGSLGTQEANNMQASSRYTEAKPSTYTDLMFNEYKKNVVPTKETYNGEYQEPVFLPALFPNALVNGREAIGVSISSNSLPNNLTEVCNAIIHYIQKDGNVDIKEIMNDIKGPDFPLGGEVINSKDIYTAFATGKSNVSLKVRGNYTIEKNKIIFTSIPYRTYRNVIKEQINKNIDIFDNYFSDFDDESNVGQNKLVFTLKRDIDPKEALNKLFAYTDLQTTLSYNMNFIVNGTPKLCSIKDLITAYYNHQIEVILNATKYDLDVSKKKLHILEGLYVACCNIQKVVDIIRGANDRANARTTLIKELNIDEEQANAILDMRLARLTKLDTMDIQNDIQKHKDIIENCLQIINNKTVRDEYLIKEITDLRDKYGDPRRTILNDYSEEQIKEASKTTAKKQNVKYYLATNKNGLISFDSNSSRNSLFSINSNDLFCVFTSFGNMYKINPNSIITKAKTNKSINLSNYLKMESGEEIKYLCSMNDLPKLSLLAFSQMGYYKKIDTTDLYTNSNRQGKTSYYNKLLDDNDFVFYIGEIGKSKEVTIDLSDKTSKVLLINDIGSYKRSAKGKNLKLKDARITKVRL